MFSRIFSFFSQLWANVVCKFRKKKSGALSEAEATEPADERSGEQKHFDQIVSGIRKGENIYPLAQIIMLDGRIFIAPLSRTFGNILHESVACCNEAAIKFLVTQQSVIPNYVNIPGLGGQTPLYEAVRIKDPQRCQRIVLFLLKNGADPYHVDGLGRYFIDYCRSDAPIRREIDPWLDKLEETGKIAEDIPDFGKLPPIPV